ncbi:MAG TPA: general secretion pathway protein GspB [Ramlibacter sp.]|uniref:general secretion pathway protein GspB n=1 Tax=Ramlibacter sp. TaxID=1917967 RepID=UPI002D7F8682|nr:general secretion pathway protein GspB [Ramlibacter sp.]HET8747730.1 general secretion pathway protein GspB [Ramlibacter sp.]
MSYILDALRRADAERERDPGRGIHAQPVPLPAETGRRIPWWMVAAVAALVLLVAGALLLRPSPRILQDLRMPPPNAPVPRPPVAAPPAPTVAAEASPPAATPAAATEVIPPAPATPTVANEVSPPPPVVAAQVSPPPPAAPERPLDRAVVRAPAAPSVPTPTAGAKVPATTTATAPATAPAPTPAAAPAATPAAERIFAASELPADVQRELPKLQISGGVHSDNPSQRMLIVGGQVITEGAEAAPGVLVEQIRPKSAVLKFRGWRYSVQY